MHTTSGPRAWPCPPTAPARSVTPAGSRYGRWPSAPGRAVRCRPRWAETASIPGRTGARCSPTWPASCPGRDLRARCPPARTPTPPPGGHRVAVHHLAELGRDRREAHRKITRARAQARRHLWQLLEQRPEGFPWVQGEGIEPTGVTVIDTDASVIPAPSEKDGAAGTHQQIFGHHPVTGFCEGTGELLADRLRPGNTPATDADDNIALRRAVSPTCPGPTARRSSFASAGPGSATPSWTGSQPAAAERARPTAGGTRGAGPSPSRAGRGGAVEAPGPRKRPPATRVSLARTPLSPTSPACCRICRPGRTGLG